MQPLRPFWGQVWTSFLFLLSHFSVFVIEAKVIVIPSSCGCYSSVGQRECSGAGLGWAGAGWKSFISLLIQNQNSFDWSLFQRDYLHVLKILWHVPSSVSGSLGPWWCLPGDERYKLCWVAGIQALHYPGLWLSDASSLLIPVHILPFFQSCP